MLATPYSSCNNASLISKQPNTQNIFPDVQMAGLHIFIIILFFDDHVFILLYYDLCLIG